MGSSSKFKPGIVALFAVGVVQQATALPQIELDGDNRLHVPGSDCSCNNGAGICSCSRDDCEAVAAALNSLKYGSTSISGVECYSRNCIASCKTFELGRKGSGSCKQVAATLNSLWYGSSSISGVYCNYDTLQTDESKDVELLNTLLALSVKGYSNVEVFQAADLADVKSSMASAVDLADVKSGIADLAVTTSTGLADVKSGMATTTADLADMKNQLADLKALLTPECTANRLARAQGNSATDPANSSEGKTNIAAIVVPIVAVLLVAAVVATVLVMKGRGNNAYAEVERRAANAPPATTQPNPASNPADAADAVPEPGSDEDIDL